MPGANPDSPGDSLGENSWFAGRYRIGHEIARGGEGAVYSVVDEQTGEVRALKRLLPPATAKMRAQFEREYRTLAGIRHPRIIEVYDYGIDRGDPYYTMELLDGQDLRELAPLSVADAFRYLRDVATSLALLHTRRLLHRDIKASNIRVTADGHCKLLDFGALTPFGMPERVAGTPPYLPPEALRRAPLDQRADLYGFGALSYWLLTRKQAYPARQFTELPELWHKRAAPPSRYNPEIPKAVDRLIMGLLDPDPMARPNSAAEVVELLNKIADLPPEDAQTQRALGESYLATTHFIGRGPELQALEDCVAELAERRGSLHVLEGPGGVGRTRLLEELHMRARMAGLTTVHVDAAMHDRPRGTMLAAVSQLIDASEAARRAAGHHARLLNQLDPNLGLAPEPAATTGTPTAQAREVLLGLVRAACEEGPLLLLVDNAAQADIATLGILESAARFVGELPLSLVLAGRTSLDTRPTWSSLRQSANLITVAAFTEDETLELSRTVFGDVPNLVGLAQWLHKHSGGLPLHSVEILRQLYRDDVIRFDAGVWLLPIGAPQVEIPPQLEALIDRQLDTLSPEAYALAEAVAIRRGVVVGGDSLGAADLGGPAEYRVMEELLHRNVLTETVDGYSFRNNAMRDAVDGRMVETRRRQLHLQCAEQLIAHNAQRATDHNAAIAAGWHLLHAGEDARGADMLAAVAYDNIGVRLSFADLQVVAPALEAAYEVFVRQGRTLFERAPLLAALAQAGYYEHRRWAHKYGELAIDACEEVTGLKTARRLRPWLGKTASLATGIALAWLRFRLAPRHARRCSFRDLNVQLMGLVTCLVGVAACSMDSDKARRLAGVLEPFMHLPDRLTPVGLGQFCYALSEIGRDNPAQANAILTRTLEHFDDPRYYPTLPKAARPLYHGGLWFARGVFEAFRDQGGALRAADELDALGMKMYRLIAAELRMLHHANRGNLELAQKHARTVEIHVAEMGSASLVELWEPAALILAYGAMGEVVGLRNLCQRLREHARNSPIMAHYAKLADLALQHATRDRMRHAGQDIAVGDAEAAEMRSTLDMLAAAKPREFIGWGFLAGQAACALNWQRRHAEAKQICLRVMDVIGDDDRQYVALFLMVELELAVAEAGLGNASLAARQLDALLQTHARSDNPLTRGRLHEAYCRVAAIAQRWTLFRHHLEATRSYYRATGSSALAGRVEMLAALERSSSRPPASTTDTMRMRVLRAGEEQATPDGEEPPD